MSALPISLVLRDVGPDKNRNGKAKGGAALTGEAAARADMEGRIAEARALGFAEGVAAERAAGEARLAEQAAAHERRLSSERQTWVSEEGARLADLIASETGGVEQRTAGTLARALKPILIEGVKGRAVSELIAAIEGLVSKGDLARLSVSGPTDLLAVIRDRLGSKIERVTFTTAETCDFKVVADETTFETRIGDWVRAIGGDET